MSSPRFLHRTSISNLRLSFMSGSRCSSARTFMSAIVHGLGGRNTYIHTHTAVINIRLIFKTRAVVHQMLACGQLDIYSQLNYYDTTTNFGTINKCHKFAKKNSKNPYPFKKVQLMHCVIMYNTCYSCQLVTHTDISTVYERKTNTNPTLGC